MNMTQSVFNVQVNYLNVASDGRDGHGKEIHDFLQFETGIVEVLLKL